MATFKRLKYDEDEESQEKKEEPRYRSFTGTQDTSIDNPVSSYVSRPMPAERFEEPEPVDDRSLWQKTVDFITSRRGEASIGAAQQWAADEANSLTALYAAGEGGRAQRSSELLADWQNQLATQQQYLRDATQALKKDHENPELRAYVTNLMRNVEDLQTKISGLQSAQGADAGTVQAAYQATDSLSQTGQQHIENAKEGLGPVGSRLVDAGAQMTQMFLDEMGAKALGFATVGTGKSSLLNDAIRFAPFEARSFGGGAKQAYDNGATGGQAAMYGTYSAAKEYIMEKLLGSVTPFKTSHGGTFEFANGVSVEGLVNGAIDRFVSKLPEGVAQTISRAGLTGSWAFISEFLEEFGGNMLDWMTQADRIYGGQPDTFTEYVQSGIDEGLTAGLSALLGFPLSGAIERGNEIKAAKAEYGSDPSGLVAETAELAPDSKIVKNAQSRLDAGKKLSGNALRNLSDLNQKATTSADIDLIRNSAAERLRALGETGNVDAIADAITRSVVKRSLGQEETIASMGFNSIANDRALRDSKYGQRVLNELDPENIMSQTYESGWAENIGTKRINPAAYTLTGQIKSAAEAAAETERRNRPIAPRQSDLTYDEAEEPTLTGNETVDSVVRKAYNTELSGNDVRQILADDDAMTALQDAVGTLDLKGKSPAEQRALVREAVTQYAAQNRPAEAVSMTRVPADVAAFAKQYGRQESAVRSIYNMAPVDDMASFASAFDAAYRIGLDGGSEQAAVDSELTQIMTENQRHLAYATGRDARTADGSAPKLGSKRYGRDGIVRANGMTVKEINRRFRHGSNQKDAVSLLRAFSAATGFTIELFDSAGDYTRENGSFDWSDDVIRIDINSGINNITDVESLAKYTMLRTFAHEFTHAGEKWAASEYNTLRAAVMEALSNNSEFDLDGRISQIMEEQGLSWDMASREVVAEAMTDVLPESRFMDTLLRKDASLAQKLVNALKDFISRIQKYFADIVSNPSREAQALKVEVNGAVRYMKGIVEKWDAMVVAASENYKQALAEQRQAQEEYEAKPEKATAADITREGIGSVVDENGKAMFQLRTMKQDLDGYMDDLRAAGLVGDGKPMSEQDLTDLYSSINTVMDYVENHLNEIERSESFRNMDGTNRPFLPYKENSDPHYRMALDYSTLCRKRLLTQAITERLQAALGRAIKPVEQVKIRNEIKKLQAEGKKIDVACALCYVEAARLKSPKVINEFLNNRSESLKNYFSLKNSRFKKEVYEKRRGDWKEARGLDRNATKDQIKAAGYKPSVFNQFSVDIRKDYWSWLEKAQPDVFQKQSEIIRTAESMDASEFLSASSLSQLRLNMPELYDAFISKVRSATRSKAQETDVPYKRGDINAVGQALIDQMNEESGFRHQSWSDFQAMHLLDTVAAIIELSTRNAKVHTYTKVADMVRLLGRTNMAINMSLIPNGETGLKEDGSLDFDPVEGIDFDEMVKLRDEFHATAGNIAIGITDDQIRAMMASPYIDYIIPYHTSGLNADMRKRMGIRAWKDYTKWQNESGGEGPGLSEWFSVQEGLKAEDGIAYMVKASEKYLRLCHERGVVPKFPQFLVKNSDGSYSLSADAKNYWKLLIDRKMVDQITRSVIVQQPVIPRFDTDTMLDILSKEVNSEAVRDAKEAEDKIVKMLLSGDVVFTKQELAQARAIRDVAVRHAIESTAAEADAPQRQMQRRIEAPEGLTPEQQKNFDINQNQTETGSLLKTLAGTTIKRFNGIVGKNLGTVSSPQVYFNRQYADEIVPSDVISRAESIMRDAGLDPDDFRCAMWDKAKNIYRFDESPDFDTAREPIPGRQVTVDLNKGSITRDRYSSDIWHHKWLWVENDYQGFDVDEAWNWSKTYLSTIRPVMPSEHSFSNNKATDADYAKKGSFAQRGIADAGIWNEQLDYFGLPRDKSTRTQYSLRLVEPVQPTNGGWERTHTTQEAMDAAAEKGIRMWDVSADYSNEKNPTSMTLAEGGTTLTYRKVFSYLGDDYSGRILDASSGQGYGTRIGQDMGYGIEDIEPYPDDYNYQFIKGTDEEEVITIQQVDKKTGKLKNVKRTVNKNPRHPKYMDYSELDDKVSSGEIEPFDFIISNAVLNVVPQDQRDALVTHMGHILAPGGQMFVNVRKIDEIRKLGNNPKNAKLGDHEAVESSGGSYQYGFGNSEIVDYLRDVLGDGYTVIDGRKIFGTSSPTALVTKDGGPRGGRRTDDGGRQYEIRRDFDDESKNIESGTAAVTELIEKAKTAEDPTALTVEKAMYRSDIGYIDFKWGTPGRGNKFKGGYGLAHIIAKRDSEGANGTSVAYKLVEVIAKATTVDYQNNGQVGSGLERIRLFYGDYTAIISKSEGRNPWVLTGWENKKEADAFATGEGYDSSSATSTKPTLTRLGGVDASTSSDNLAHTEPESQQKKQNSVRDSDGSELSEQQAEYFKDSKVRDADGNLLVMYHGTSNHGFTVFDANGKGKYGLFGIGNYFTESREVAETYQEKGRGSSKGTYDVYLNITNPLDMDGNVDIEQWKNAFRIADADTDYLDGCRTNTDCYRALEEFCRDEGMYRYEAEEMIQDMIRGMGYDGITHIGGLRRGGGEKIHRVYITFDPEQSKSVSNVNPTADPDIRYSRRTGGTPSGIEEESSAPKFTQLQARNVNGMTYYSGGGLVDYALRAQLEHQMAVEIDSPTAEVYRMNNGQNIFVGDVRDFDVDTIRGDIPYFHASPVCKTYSKAISKDAKARRLESEIDILTARATAEAIRKLQGKGNRVITIENVKEYRGSEALKIITDALDKYGYTWDTDLPVYNSADFGAATSRERLLIRAVKDGTLPAKPTPTNSGAHVGWYDAVSDLIDDLDEAELPSWLVSKLEGIGIDPDNVSKPLYVAGDSPGATGIPHAYADKPVPTITANTHMPFIIMPDGRVLQASPRVIARLQGLPDSYQLPTDRNGRTLKGLSKKIIGNGVPVQLTQAVFGPLLDANFDESGSPLTMRLVNSDIRYQRRQQSYTDREVLELASDVLDSRKLTDGERAALDIFNTRLNALKSLEEQRDDLRRTLEDQKNDGAGPEEIQKTKNRLSIIGKKIRAAENAVLSVEDKQVLKKVLHEARGVVEREQRQIHDSKDARKKHIARIKETTLKLSEWLRKNSDKEHVPEILKKPLTEFLNTLDFSSTRFLNGGEMTREDRKFAENLVKINSLISGQQDAINGKDDAIDNVGAYLDISPENREFLNGLVNLMATNSGGSFTLNEMSVEQLKALDKFMRNLGTAIAKANRALANARYRNIPEMANESIKHFEAMGKARASDGTKASRFLKWTNATPYYAFKRFGEAGKSLFDGFSRGWEQLAKNLQEIFDFTENTYKPSEVRAWKKEIHNITLEDGSKIQMTTGQLMALTQLFQRPQAVQHITAGGIRIGTIKQKRGSINDTKHYHLTLGDMQKLNDLLTDRQKEVAQKLRSWMGKRGEEWGNEISMARFGYEFYTEGEGYYPIRTDDNVRPMKDTDDAQNASMFRLLNLSFSKSLNPHASNALVVDDIFDTFADHMSDMAKLHALGLPLLDAIKWYNYTERINGEGTEYSVRGLKGSMEQAFGSAAGSYFKTLLKDINGAKEARDRGNFDLTSNYKIAAVAANLRVAFLQPTSYIRAMAILNPKYMLTAFTSKNAYKEALEYSGTAVWKSLGYYDTDISRSIRSQIQNDATWLDRVKEGSMTLAEIGDNRTWGRLWVACKQQTKAENPELTGEDLKVKTADLFREVIYATQVMDSTLTRSEIMRSTTKWDKLKTAFMAEPTQSLNLIMDSFSQYSIDRRKTNTSEALRLNGGRMARAFTTYVSSAALAALVESVIDAARDDDDYETFLQKFRQAFFGENGFLTGNFGQDLTILGKIPLVKDIINTILGDKSSDMSFASIEAITNSYRIWRETIQLANGTLEKPTKVTYNGNMTDWGKIYKTLQALSQLSGVAVSNLTRDAVAIWNVFMPDNKIQTYAPKTATAIRTSAVSGFLTPDQAYDEMIRAGEDVGAAEKLRDQVRFIRSGKGFDAISEAAAHGYYNYAEAAGISEETYYDAWQATKAMTGDDSDGDGKSDTYSKLDKQLAYIDSLDLTRKQKYALASALTGAAEKTIMKRARFH
ncbi:MAG: DNA cytosine methyltransferase [Bacteroidales bacterium]|nr:DNA cytosine methyltransferase [Bacteroidales bacterium]